MVTRRSRRTLTERDLEILRDVIHTYVLTAEPVSSRTVAKHDQHDLSAASIRNIMADLADLGYLAQPHTSAGRVPTPLAYHLFIDSLMQVESLTAEERRLIDEQLSGHAESEQLVAAASQVLSHLSRQVGMVLTPSMGATTLRAIEFAPLSDRRVLCVAVSTNGFVDNKVVTSEEEISREDLVRISNYLTENFGGLTLSEIRERLLRLMEDERAQMDALLRHAIALGNQGLPDARTPELVVDGTGSLLNQPELADLTRVRRLFDTFSDKARLVTMLNQCMEGEGVRVWIGDDSDLTSDLDFSLVVKRYGVRDQALGSLAIFGPSRMQYSRVIPLVAYLAEQLSARLAEAT